MTRLLSSICYLLLPLHTIYHRSVKASFSLDHTLFSLSLSSTFSRWAAIQLASVRKGRGKIYLLYTQTHTRTQLMSNDCFYGVDSSFYLSLWSSLLRWKQKHIEATRLQIGGYRWGLILLRDLCGRGGRSRRISLKHIIARDSACVDFYFRFAHFATARELALTRFSPFFLHCLHDRSRSFPWMRVVCGQREIGTIDITAAINTKFYDAPDESDRCVRCWGGNWHWKRRVLGLWRNTRPERVVTERKTVDKQNNSIRWRAWMFVVDLVWVERENSHRWLSAHCVAVSVTARGETWYF